MKLSQITCPVCDEGKLTQQTHELILEYAEKRIRVPDLEHSSCDVCGADPVLPEQVRRNEARIADIRREADGLLTGVQIRALRTALGLSQPQASELFGGGPNAFSKYERGEVRQSVAMDRLLRIAFALPTAVEMLRDLSADESLKKRAAPRKTPQPKEPRRTAHRKLHWDEFVDSWQRVLLERKLSDFLAETRKNPGVHFCVPSAREGRDVGESGQRAKMEKIVEMAAFRDRRRRSA